MRTLSRMAAVLVAVAKEPPFRRLANPLIRALPVSLAMKSLWDAADRAAVSLWRAACGRFRQPPTKSAGCGRGFRVVNHFEMRCTGLQKETRSVGTEKCLIVAFD